MRRRSPAEGMATIIALQTDLLRRIGAEAAATPAEVKRRSRGNAVALSLLRRADFTSKQASKIVTQ